MASAPSTRFLTQHYRIRTNTALDGATCFLRPVQALGHELPDPVPAYAPGRECRPVAVPASDILGFEPV